MVPLVSSNKPNPLLATVAGGFMDIFQLFLKQVAPSKREEKRTATFFKDAKLVLTSSSFR